MIAINTKIPTQIAQDLQLTPISYPFIAIINENNESKTDINDIHMKHF